MDPSAQSLVRPEHARERGDRRRHGIKSKRDVDFRISHLVIGKFHMGERREAAKELKKKGHIGEMSMRYLHDVIREVLTCVAGWAIGRIESSKSITGKIDRRYRDLIAGSIAETCAGIADIAKS